MSSLDLAGPNISMSNTSFDGALSFPREVTIEAESGVLRFAPVKEFMVLRRMHEHQEGVQIADGGTGVALGMKGQMLDIEIVFAPSTAAEFGVQVLASADFSTEVVRIGFNASRQSAFIDVRNASAGSVGMPWVYDAPLTLTAGRSFAMRCLIDQSVLECFFDEVEAGAASQPRSYRRVITARSYFSQPTSAHIGLYSFGAASVAASADVWAVAATDGGG